MKEVSRPCTYGIKKMGDLQVSFSSRRASVSYFSRSPADLTLCNLGSKPSQTGNHGAWDSIHTLEVNERGRQAQYKIVSTTMLWVGNASAADDAAGVNGVSLSGTMTRDVSRRCEWNMGAPADLGSHLDLGSLNR
jgi:hypothetical protein